MTSGDRVRKAMNMEHPDRVPLMCQFSWGFMNQQLKETDISPMELWLDAERYAKGLLYLRNKFQFDGILVSAFGHSKNWRKKIRSITIENGIEMAQFDHYSQRFVDDDLPVGYYSLTQKCSVEDFDLSTIPEELDYIPTSKGCYIYINGEDPYQVYNILAEKTKARYSIHGEVTSPLDYLLDLLGYENALIAMATDPVKVKQILEKFTSGVIKMATDLARLKVIDAIKISSPFAGMGFISPEYYSQFELPFLSRIAKAISDKGKHSYVHTCGHINDRLELIATACLSGIECLDPPPIGNIELEDAFKRIGNKLFIKGNIDSVHTLLEADEQGIRSDIQNRLRIGKHYPGFILSTACSIAPKVSETHVKMLYEIVEAYGYY